MTPLHSQNDTADFERVLKEKQTSSPRYNQVISEETKPADLQSFPQLQSASEMRGCRLPLPELGRQRNADPKSPLFWV